jgi:hypothetical protein
LHQHDIHVHHNGLEKVSGNARTVDLERLNVTQGLGGIESNQRSSRVVSCFGEANFRAVFYAEISVNQILIQGQKCTMNICQVDIKPFDEIAYNNFGSLSRFVWLSLSLRRHWG